MISLGIEQLLLEPSPWLSGQRIGLLCNQASLTAGFKHSRNLLIQSFPGQLSCLFSPQHGFMAEKQDNMIESGHGIDPDTDLPVFSLYGDDRRPTAAMLEHLDVLFIDLVDVGTRVYTFMSTMAFCLEEAARLQKRVVILDRPNPISGAIVEGNILASDCRSFVGMYPIPMRHGMTMAELALYFNSQLTNPADLTVIPMAGWDRQQLYPETKLPWIYPSPNMPSFLTAAVYPGQVIWEGINISEGRGTAMPFEICGAPYADCREVLAYIADIPHPGCFLRPIGFEPTSNKWQGKVCQGVQIHITDFESFMPYRTSLMLLQAFANLYPDDFRQLSPPYEYEFDRQPIDLIIGDKEVRKAVIAGDDLLDIEHSWQGKLAEFKEMRKEFLLY